MKLPILRTSNKLRGLELCQGTDHCKDCSLSYRNGGRCSTCTQLHKSVLSPNFQACYQECNTCNKGYKVETPAICCRSPLKDAYLTALSRGTDYNNPVFNPVKQPLLTFSQKAILNYAFGSPERIAPEEEILFPDQEVALTTLSFVKGKQDVFYHSDLKKYLKLSPTTKLILSTMSIDDHLEAAWEREQYGGDFYERVGVDYWTPLAFSIFGREPKMFQYYQFLRLLWSAEQGKSHFVISAVPRTSLQINDLLEKWLEASPQVMFNAQMATNEHIVHHKTEAKFWDDLAPKHVAFWYVGASTPVFMANIREVLPKREIYWVSSKPMWCANSGKILRKDGGEARAEFSISKKDLLYENAQNFTAIVSKYG